MTKFLAIAVAAGVFLGWLLSDSRLLGQVYNVSEGTNFLTVTNVAAVRLGGGDRLFRFTDAQWSLVTNAYSRNLTNYTVVFYK